MTLTWHWLAFKDLSVIQLYDILALRQKVFIVEQNCVYQDCDYLDLQAMHLLGMKENQLVAYLRLLPKGLRYVDGISFGRVLTKKNLRQQKLGKELMCQLFVYLAEINNQEPIIISAQYYLKKFYESFSFKCVGEIYLEDGIEHIKMVKK